MSNQPRTHRENLRRCFGLVLRNAEHVDSRSSQEARTIGRVVGYVVGSVAKNRYLAVFCKRRVVLDLRRLALFFFITPDLAALSNV